jgi:hypothetical protein
MATPHLAGSAAVVQGQHPTWSAAQVRSAIVNTAAEGVLKNFQTAALESDPLVTGAGLDDLLAAVNAKVALDPVSVSFGAVPSGSGQTRTATVTVTNMTGSSMTLGVSVGAGGGGVAYSVAPTSLTIPAGGSAALTLTMVASKGAAPADHPATLRLSSGGMEIAHAVVYSFVK